jgi:hypothetical protein
MMDACRLQSTVSFDTICRTWRRSSWCGPPRRSRGGRGTGRMVQRMSLETGQTGQCEKGPEEEEWLMQVK